HKLVDREIVEAVALRGGDECFVDVEDTKLNKLVKSSVRIVLLRCFCELRSDAMDLERHKLFRRNGAESCGLHAGDKLRCDLEYPVGDEVLERGRRESGCLEPFHNIRSYAKNLQ